ncbi:MAG: methyl-accepting chemotaxis protein, partial [Thermotogaceae bacterium]|nr:methyl-accepting chemotaxis protein [Thermotogaceae bacterium]
MAKKIENNNSEETKNGKRRNKIKNNSKKEETMADSKMSANVLNELETLFESIKKGRLDARANLGDTTGADRKMLEGVNEMLDAIIGPLNVAAEYVDRISKGNIPEKITDEYKGDFNEVKNNLNQCIDAINLMVSDGKLLVEAMQEGKLDMRTDAERHAGAFREIIEGFNSSMDAVIGPLNVAAEYMDRISKGDIPEKITEEMKGDFNEIKNNLNQCIDAINLMVSDGKLLVEAMQEGK